MLQFLTGTDHFRLRLRERALMTEFQDTHPVSEERIFDGRDVDDCILSNLQESLSGGLFANPRVILIRHVELFDEKLCDAMIRIMTQKIPEEVCLITSAELSGRVKKGNTLQLWLAKNAKTEEVNVLTGRALSQSILELLRSIDVKAEIESRANELLGLRTGGVTGHIYHDLLKLVLATEGRIIIESDVRNLVEEPTGESVSFTLLDALVRGNRELAIGLLRREETNDDAVFKLLGLFAWQVRQALMVRDEYDRGSTSPDNIAAAIGAKPFSVKKLLPLIPKLSLDRLKRSLAHLSDLDHGIKTGQIRPGVALDLFVWKF
ncbi:MAG: DNA polymerase III subunit delta [Candidatus Moraniibacteriota bacterium]